MSGIKTVHQCLFCSQTFENAAEKDDHILGHFAQKTCTECNQNLIQIGSNLYTLHNSITCIKGNPKLEQQEEHHILGEDEQNTYNFDDSDFTTATPLLNIFDDQIEIKDEPTIDYFADKTTGIDVGDIQVKEECMYDDDTEIKETIFTEQLQPSMVENPNQPSSSKVSKTPKSKSKRKPAKNDIPLDKLKCDICAQTFSHVYNVKRHKVYFHSQPGTLFCKTCLKIFETFEELTQHRIECYAKIKIRMEYPKIHAGKTFECYICRRVTDSRRKLSGHMRWVHLPKKNQQSSVKFICTWCGKMFEKANSLREHERIATHSGEKPHVCEQCGKCFAAKSACRAHMKHVHEGKKRYQCRIDGCDQEFGGFSGFRKHKRDVHGISFVEKKKVKELKIPTEKQYKCPYEECGRIFRYHSGRYRHVKEVHEGEKHYKCKIDGCRQSFGGFTGLKKHKRDVHGIPFDETRKKKLKLPSEKQYKCPYEECGKIFIYHSSRYRHVKEVHEGVKQYKCKIEGCIQTFGGAVGLKKHKRNVHGITDDWNNLN